MPRTATSDRATQVLQLLEVALAMLAEARNVVEFMLLPSHHGDWASIAPAKWVHLKKVAAAATADELRLAARKKVLRRNLAAEERIAALGIRLSRPRLMGVAEDGTLMEPADPLSTARQQLADCDQKLEAVQKVLRGTASDLGSTDIQEQVQRATSDWCAVHRKRFSTLHKKYAAGFEVLQNDLAALPGQVPRQCFQWRGASFAEVLRELGNDVAAMLDHRLQPLDITDVLRTDKLRDHLRIEFAQIAQRSSKPRAEVDVQDLIQQKVAAHLLGKKPPELSEWTRKVKDTGWVHPSWTGEPGRFHFLLEQVVGGLYHRSRIVELQVWIKSLKKRSGGTRGSRPSQER